MKLRDLLELTVEEIVRLSSRNDRHKVLRAQGRMLLPKMYVDDVDWPHKLVAMNRLRRDQVDNPDAVTAATIKFIDDQVIADVFIA
jgi:hypothetical protein